jgi:hypothetical protein
LEVDEGIENLFVATLDETDSAENLECGDFRFDIVARQRPSDDVD